MNKEYLTYENEILGQEIERLAKEVEKLEKVNKMLLNGMVTEAHTKETKEIERLNNIIKEVEKRLEQGIEDNKKEYNLKSQMAVFVLRDTLELIEELKGSDKE